MIWCNWSAQRRLVVDIGGTHGNMNNAYHICYIVCIVFSCYGCCFRHQFYCIRQFNPFFRHFFLLWNSFVEWKFEKSLCNSMPKRKWINIVFVVYWLHFTIVVIFSSLPIEKWLDSNVILNMSLFQFNSWKNEAFNSVSDANFRNR